MPIIIWMITAVDDDRDGGALRGTITRKVICTLLKHKAFGPASADPKSQRRISPLVNWGTLECIYPRYPDVDDLSITEVERYRKYYDDLILLSA